MSTVILELLFPMALYKAKVAHTFSKEEVDKIKNGKYTEGHNRTYSDFDFRFLDNPIFTKLKKELQMHVDNYAKDIFKYDSEIYITQSWLNFNPPGSSHTVHNHSNSVFSGVYYITLPKGAPFLTFYSPIKHMFHFEPTEYNSYNLCRQLQLHHQPPRQHLQQPQLHRQQRPHRQRLRQLPRHRHPIQRPLLRLQRHLRQQPLRQQRRLSP